MRAIRGLVTHASDERGARQVIDEEVRRTIEGLFFETLPRDNVHNMRISLLGEHAGSQQRFLRLLQADGGCWSRVRVGWHSTTSAEAAVGIEAEGIRCAKGQCSSGRYGLGGYVALTAAKANAYGTDSVGESIERHVFVVLALPDEDLVPGVRGQRPRCTAADSLDHPTELCFVEEARLHCVAHIRYSWLPTRRRMRLADLDRLALFVRSPGGVNFAPHAKGGIRASPRGDRLPGIDALRSQSSTPRGKRGVQRA